MHRRGSADSPKKAHNSAWARATRALARAPKTERELTNKLKAYDYTEKEIEEAIEKLKALNWLNDVDFALNWLDWRARSNPVGPRWAYGYLSRRGVSRTDIEQTVEAFYKEHPEGVLAAQAAQNWLKSHSAGTRRQLLSFLNRRGFSSSECIETVEALFNRQGLGD